MNKSSNKNSALETPLDAILGSKGHVMVLRRLTESDSPMSPSELIKRTSLSRQGVYNVIQRLAETGILRYVGSGKHQQITIREEYPLADIISALFKRERDQYDNFIKRLKELIKSLEIKPKSAWIFGKIAQGTDDYGDPVRIALLGDLKTIDELTESFRNRIYENAIENEFDVTIDVRGVTVADIESRPIINSNKPLMLWGMDPQHYLVSWKDEREGRRSHQDLDHQSHTDAQVWSELLKMYPDIIKRTISNLENRITQTSSGEKKELQEWKRILESMSFQRLKKFLESDSERATRLRQSLPFWEILNEQERHEFEKLKIEESLK
ncbi:winged helix-turn-helix domain-containing protein [Fodinibius salsisoli]|uniref:Winged helix-turn-helix transcriptional regulator n=1 Tax=Fodinibius salsisoli TaxID=2820877 RepID=A0ABT3PSG0_9BACT|nr:winged helix-turn-helix domain-containing protein [Fodinibius salsisoli]MCW9708805.1 winged helix-turn-helix transcriptional regulator [Fodinibius salsisoli]